MALLAWIWTLVSTDMIGAKWGKDTGGRIAQKTPRLYAGGLTGVGRTIIDFELLSC
jgi:hypothetical protein